MLSLLTSKQNYRVRMTLVSLCRRHVVKLIIVITFVYLMAVYNFFGSVDRPSASSARNTERKTERGVKSDLKSENSEAELIANQHYKGPGEAKKPYVAVASVGSNAPIYQMIDVNEKQKQIRLNVLKEIYAVPHSSDDVYKLNESHSRTIDLDRPPNDLRPDECKSLQYDLNHLPTISLIMPIYNEALSMLLRAVHSVINNTPQRLLADIILVDDNSKNENLKEPLEKYLKYLPSKVRVLRNDKREGLIRARMRGAAVAKGEVLMFQDVHTEFSMGWAEPILKYIKENPNTVVQPTVEELQVSKITWPDKQDIDYTRMWRGTFMWDMRYAWNMVPEKYNSWKLTPVDPFPNPVLVGCSLAVDRKFFDHLGGFDQGLNIWGGENIELSLRTWMCGGRMVIHPCSRIAHVFKPFSYSFDGDKEKIIAKNSARVVESWMDDFRHYFYASNYIYPYKRVQLDEDDKRSLREHKALRDRLKCKSFQWYLDNVLPEMARPSRHVRFHGEIQNQKSNACFKVNDDGYISATMDCYTYSRLKDDQEFSLTESGQLMHYDKCVAVQDNLLLKTQTCGTNIEREQGWSFEILPHIAMQIGRLKFTHSDRVEKCIQQITNILEIGDHAQTQMPQTLDCREEADFKWQLWFITYNLDYSLVPPKPL